MRIKEIILSRGLQQKDIAKALGIATNTFSQYVTGKRQPDFETLTMLADYLNVSVDYLLGRDTEIKKDPGIVSNAEIDEGAMLLRSLPEHLQEEAMRYLRFLASEKSKQASEDK